MGLARSLAQVFCAIGISAVLAAAPAHAFVIGIDSTSGKLYEISTDDASLDTLIGNTGVTNFADIAMAPSGELYGFTSGSTACLYKINPETAATNLVGTLGTPSAPVFIFEGALAFGPDGTAYAANMGSTSSPKLFTIDTQTGQATPIGTMSGGAHDINGMAWRSDGLLVGLDVSTNALVLINPATAEVSLLRSLAHLNKLGQPILGSNGGLTIEGNTGYFSTAAPNATIPGSGELYSFDLFTGDTQRVGSLLPALDGKGFSGIAAPIPDPATFGLLALGSLALLIHRRFR